MRFLEFQIKVLFIAFITTIICSMGIIPILKKLKVGQIERDDGPSSHLRKQGTPTMGGIIISLSIIIVSILVIFYYYHTDAKVAMRIIPLLLVTIGFGTIGFIDDFKKLILRNTKGLKPAYKMLGLLTISVLYALFLVKGSELGIETYIPIIRKFLKMSVLIYIPFAIFVMLATTNAINLTDGVDGLSTSVCTIIITCLTVIGIIFDVKEVVIFGSIVVGACLGFLLFNLHPAKIFMGDTGSLLLRRCYKCISIIFKNAFNNNSNCIYPCYRDCICNNASNIF